MAVLTRTLLRAYGLAWKAATPLLARHTRLADGFAERLVPEGWPFTLPEGATFHGNHKPELSAPDEGARLAASGCPHGKSKPERSPRAEIHTPQEYGRQAQPLVWIQAASGGEAWLVHSLVKALATLPETAHTPLTLLCTTFTRQGLEILEKLAGEQSTGSNSGSNSSSGSACGSGSGPGANFTILPRYFPLDKPDIMLRAVRQAGPKAIVLLETELWPGLLEAAGQEGVPVLILNARMSEKSLSGYGWLSGFWKSRKPESVLAISPEDAARFASLFQGTDIGVMHNIKFDRLARPGGNEVNHGAFQGPEAATSVPGGDKTPENGQKAGEDARRPKAAGQERAVAPKKTGEKNAAAAGYAEATAFAPLVVLASVREEEEGLLAPVVQELLAAPMAHGRLRVAVAPRHMHRISAWRKVLCDQGLEYSLRSEAKHIPEDAQTPPPEDAQTPAPEASVLLWDTFGEMHKLYARADAVFVGGSLAPLGGQNFLEPLAEGLIPCVGPHRKNFLWVGEDLFSDGLAVPVASARTLAPALLARLEQVASRAAALSDEAPGNELSAKAWAKAGATLREETRERFEAWLQPRLGGSMQAAATLARFL